MATIHERKSYITCQTAVGHYKMAYREYWSGGNENAPPTECPTLICVHGLARVGADFDALARALCQTHHVICPDIVGRGDSDWLPEYASSSHYQIQSYVADLQKLIRLLDVREVDWLGTSMGGIIGLMLAWQGVHTKDTAFVQPRIRRMVLNDIGIRVPKAGLQRIAAYIGHPHSFSTKNQALAYYQENYTSFGINALADWEKFTNDSIEYIDGKWQMKYDQRIAEPFSGLAHKDIDLAPLFLSLTNEMLVLRGELSDMLLQEDLEFMTKHKHISSHVFANCGHAPALIDAEQIEVVKKFINRSSL